MWTRTSTNWFDWEDTKDHLIVRKIVAMVPKRIANNTNSLCFLPGGELLCYNRGEIQIMNEGIVDKRIPVVVSGKERLLGWSRWATRLLRFGIRAAVAVDEKCVVLSRGNVLQELNLESGLISDGWCCGEGRRPLVLSRIQGIDGFDDGVYFGEYLKNDEKKAVKIYHRVGVDQWKQVYIFPEGVINHVHNVIADPYRNCLWVFTGDFDDAAAIWQVTNGFKKVERVAFGDQKWRGCVAFATPEGLLYATDTPFSKNHIYLMRENGSVEAVGDLCGSCIYGCQWKDKYVFSSTVEADGRDESLKKLLFSKTRGSGIEDDYVRMYMGDCATGFKEVYKEKKDWLPFIFQFGVFKFPTGVNSGDTLYFQPVATDKNDLRLLALKD